MSGLKILSLAPGFVRISGCWFRVWGLVPVKQIAYGVYGDLIINIIYPNPYSIYLRGTIGFQFSFPVILHYSIPTSGAHAPLVKAAESSRFHE